MNSSTFGEPTLLNTRPGHPADVDEDLHASRHVVGEEIGRGGMGTVHRAYDPRLRRSVAMKMLNPASAADPTHVTLFVAEAQIAAQLEHPNIVPIHELETAPDGTARFTMKLIRGQSLHEWLRTPSRPVGSPERLADGLDIFMKVCDAISFAHSKGVIHRDLKPSNVMVGEFGEVYLMDWGLAKLTGKGISVIGLASESFEGPVGTPGYLAPESARGAAAEQDEGTDVFGLGALLYEIVTGKAPYQRLNADFDLILAAISGDYVPPEQTLNGIGVSRLLLRVIRTALSRERADRYPTASAMKAAVKQFLNGGLHLPRVGFAAGTQIVVEGDIGDAAYIIIRGECVVYRMVDGQKVILRTLGPGDAFGEMGVLSKLPRVATVEAVQNVAALIVNQTTLDEQLGLETWVGSLVRALAGRFRELDAQLAKTHSIP